MTIKVGDRVRLTGNEWNTLGDTKVGDIVTISGVDEDGDPYFERVDGLGQYFIMPDDGFDAELVEPEWVPKFKVGDRVRGKIDSFQQWVHGVEFVITGYESGIQAGEASGWYEGSPNWSGVWEANLELAPGAADLERQLEEAEALVESLKAQISDLKPKAQDLPNGTHVVEIDSTWTNEFVKLAHNTWAYINRFTGVKYTGEIHWYRDSDINAMNVTVKEN